MRAKKPPSDLNMAGRQLWAWLLKNCGSLAGAEPMAAELCRLQDRLTEVRDRLRDEGLTDEKGHRNPLIDVEVKLTGQYQRCWRILGLADRS